MKSKPRQQQLFVTHDGGKSWTMPVVKPWKSHGFQFKTPMLILPSETPDGSSEIWIASGDSGIYRSLDRGVSFQRICESVTLTTGLCSGAPVPPSNTPTIYLHGTVEGEDGIWMTTDRGQKFQRISPAGRPMLTTSANSMMRADPVQFGRLLIATAGTGVLAGFAD